VFPVPKAAQIELRSGSPCRAPDAVPQRRRHVLLAAARQRLTPVHFSAQRKRFLWDKGCLWGVYGVFLAWEEGVFGRLGDVLGVRNASGGAEKWTSVSPCRSAALEAAASY
jgi:hypothetical protein